MKPVFYTMRTSFLSRMKIGGKAILITFATRGIAGCSTPLTN